ncbi:MAG: sulfite exporter TauE/SafE family protein [Bacteroidota bacterium]
MSTLEGLLLIGVGIFAGFINTVAGGGSLLTLPLLIFLGLPSSEANASNRVAILIQNTFGVAGFRSKGVAVFPFALWVAMPAVVGAIIGSKIAVNINEEVFNKLLAVIMLMVMGITIFKPKVKEQLEEQLTRKKVWTSLLIFFFVGVYGGFIQAGIGFLMIAALTSIHGFNMAKTNSIKVFVALCYTIAAVIVFVINDKIRWQYGLTLAVGNATGAWVASRWSAKKSDRLIRMILLAMVVVLSVKLWFF